MSQSVPFLISWKLFSKEYKKIYIDNKSRVAIGKVGRQMEMPKKPLLRVGHNVEALLGLMVFFSFYRRQRCWLCILYLLFKIFAHSAPSLIQFLLP